MDGDSGLARCNNEHDSRVTLEASSCRDDFASVKPTLFQQLKRKVPANGVSWKRLEGYRLPTDEKEVSWIWKHEWRIVDGYESRVLALQGLPSALVPEGIPVPDRKVNKLRSGSYENKTQAYRNWVTRLRDLWVMRCYDSHQSST